VSARRQLVVVVPRAERSSGRPALAELINVMRDNSVYRSLRHTADGHLITPRRHHVLHWSRHAYLALPSSSCQIYSI